MVTASTALACKVLLGGIVVFSCYSMRAYFRCRNVFPIPPRLPNLVMIECTFLILLSFTFLTPVAFPDAYINNCVPWQLMITFTDHVPVAISAFRINYLIFRDFVTRDLVKHQEDFSGRALLSKSEDTLGASRSSSLDSLVMKLIYKFGPKLAALIVLIPSILTQIGDTLFVLIRISGVNKEISELDEECYHQLHYPTAFSRGAILMYIGFLLCFVMVQVMKMKDRLNIGTS
jgi:hypothetical protein